MTVVVLVGASRGISKSTNTPRRAGYSYVTRFDKPSTVTLLLIILKVIIYICCYVR